jgi:hypothetical protein
LPYGRLTFLSPGGISDGNIKWWAFVWAVSEAMLVASIAINYPPPRWYKTVFRFALFIMLDFFFCLIRLAPERCPQHLRVPFRQAPLHFDMYVKRECFYVFCKHAQ